MDSSTVGVTADSPSTQLASMNGRLVTGSSGGPPVAARSVRSSPLTIVGMVSAATAVFVGLVYAAGIVETVARLNDSGLSVRDALPLVPLQTLLTRGMGVMLVGGIALVLFVASLWSYVPRTWPRPGRVVVPRLRSVKRSAPPSGARARFSTWWKGRGAIVVLSLAIWVPASVSTDPLASLRYVIPFMGGVFVSRVLIRNGRRDALISAGLVVVAWAAINTAHSYLYAVPLPDVQLELRASPTVVKGTLIAHDSQTWYLTNQPGQVIALNSELVKQATITSAKPPKGRTLWELLGIA